MPSDIVVKKPSLSVRFKMLAKDSRTALNIIKVPSVMTAVAQWLRCCATNQKVAGSIPAGVIGIFH